MIPPKREIVIIDVTGKKPPDFEKEYNTNYGSLGWRIIQIFEIDTSRYILAEKEV